MILAELMFGEDDCGGRGAAATAIPSHHGRRRSGGAALAYGTAALLGGLLFWLAFPDTSGFAILMILLVVGLLFVDRQARRRAP